MELVHWCCWYFGRLNLGVNCGHGRASGTRKRHVYKYIYIYTHAQLYVHYICTHTHIYIYSIVVSFNAEFMVVREVLFILPYQVVGLIQKCIHIAAVPQTDCMVGHQQISASDLPGTSVHIITNSYYIWPVSIPKYMYIKYIPNGHILNVHCFPHRSINKSPYV